MVESPGGTASHMFRNYSFMDQSHPLDWTLSYHYVFILLSISTGMSNSEIIRDNSILRFSSACSVITQFKSFGRVIINYEYV